MLRWFPIRKRKTNAQLYGVDLGCHSAKVDVIVRREEDLRLPKPKLDITYVKPTKREK